MSLYDSLWRENHGLWEFIISFDNVLSKSECQKLIKFYESSKKASVDDHRAQYTGLQLFQDPRPEAFEWYQKLEKKLLPYAEKYEKKLVNMAHEDYKPAEILANTNGICFRSLQVQHYNPESKGYSAVHVESGKNHCKRYLACILYLNTLKDDDGATVFPLAGHWETPKAGTLVVWPSGLPFYHKGLKSSEDKYILTTWYEFL